MQGLMNLSTLYRRITNLVDHKHDVPTLALLFACNQLSLLLFRAAPLVIVLDFNVITGLVEYSGGKSRKFVSGSSL